MPIVIPAIGATSLGIVIGWLVRFFIWRFKTFSPSVLSSVISILLGGAVTKFLSHDENVWWFYPIGLLIGFVVYQIIATIEIRKERVIVPPIASPILLTNPLEQKNIVDAATAKNGSIESKPIPEPNPSTPVSGGGGGGGGGHFRNSALYAPRND
jgi:hypothetical protein